MALAGGDAREVGRCLITPTREGVLSWPWVVRSCDVCLCVRVVCVVCVLMPMVRMPRVRLVCRTPALSAAWVARRAATRVERPGAWRTVGAGHRGYFARRVARGGGRVDAICPSGAGHV